MGYIFQLAVATDAVLISSHALFQKKCNISFAKWEQTSQLWPNITFYNKLQYPKLLARSTSTYEHSWYLIWCHSFQVSVSCGIPDFRSRDGIYARLAVDFPDLPDPQAMFDIEYFRKDPRPFFKFAKVLFFLYYTGKQIFINCLQMYYISQLYFLVFWT